MVCGELRISWKTSVEDSVVNLSQDFSLWLIFAPLVSTAGEKILLKLFSNVQIDDFWYQKFSEKIRPKSDMPKSDMRKSDTFLGIWPNKKCVTF